MSRSQLYRQAKALALPVNWRNASSTVANLKAAIQNYYEALLSYATPEATAPANRPADFVDEDDVQIKVLNTDSYGPYRYITYSISYPTEQRNFVLGVELAVEDFRSKTENKDIAIVVHLIGNGEDKHRFITITHDNIMEAKGDFIAAIKIKLDKLTSGEIHGSDAISEDEFKIDDTFVRVKTGSLLSEGESEFNFAKTRIGRPSSKKLAKKECFLRSVSLVVDDAEALRDARVVNNTESVKAWAEKHHKLVEIYADSPIFTVNRDEIIMLTDAKGNKVSYTRINVTGITLMESFGSGDVIKLVRKYNARTLSFHFELFDGISDTIFYGDKNGDIHKIVKNELTQSYDRALVQKRTARLGGSEKSNKEVFGNTYILTFDFETIFDPESKGLLLPYSVSWSIRRDDEKSGRVFFYYGWDCVKVLVDWITQNQDGKKFVLLGYNSSRFDNFFLITELMARDILGDCKLVNGSILKMTFSGRHQVFDLCRYLACPLSIACQQFKPLYCKDGDLVSHVDIQKIYLSGGSAALDSYFKLQQGSRYECDFDGVTPKIGFGCDNKLVEYNMLDTLSCDCLYMSIDQILRAEKIIDRPLCEKATIGGLSWSLLQKNFKEKKITLPKLPIDLYKKVRGSLFAGRTQAYKGRYSELSGEQKYDMYDAKSLYPYAYLNNEFPCGEIQNIPYEQCVAEGKMGFYEVTFDQHMTKFSSRSGALVLPKRSEDKPLDWKDSSTQTLFLNTVDIAQLEKYGAKIHNIGNGFAFSDLIDGDELFAPMLVCKNIKEAEDKKPAAQRNSVLRNMSKLMINSASGKIIQNIFQKVEKVCRRAGELDEILEKNHDINFEKTIGNVSIVSYNKSFEECFNAQNMPIYLGCFIYSHARAHMMDSVLADYHGIYQDTDSLLMPRSEAERFAREKPHLIGGEFGQFELEDTKGRDIAKVVIIAPKCYFLFDAQDKLLKRGFKGINLNSDKLLTDEDVDQLIADGVVRKTKKGLLPFPPGHFAKSTAAFEKRHYGSAYMAEYLSLSSVQREEKFNAHLEMDTGLAFEAYHTTYAHRSLSKPENIMRLCTSLIDGRPVMIMSSSMSKNVANLSISQRFTIKNIC